MHTNDLGVTASALRLRFVWMLVVVLLSGCSAGSGEGLDQNGRPLGETPDDGGPAPVASFRQVQNEIFTPLCVVCHAGASAPVGLKLDAANSYTSLVSIASIQVPSLLRVAPGDPDMSYLVQKIDGSAAFGVRMPLGGSPVPADLVASLRQWVTDGALPDQAPPGQPATPVVVAVVPESDSILSSPPDSIVAVFSVAMDFSLLGDTTVRLTASGGDGVFDDGNDVMVVPASVSSTNPQTLVVDLAGITLDDDTYRLVFAGEGSLVLASLEGIVLDGDSDGEPGGDYEARYTLNRAAATPVASWRWIQDNVFDAQCISCHVDGGIGNLLWLDDANSFAMLVDQFSAEVGDVLLVAPGDADNSYLIQKVEGTAAVGELMPLNLPPLDADVIAAMRQWIDNGATLEPGDMMPDTNPPNVSLAAPASPLFGIAVISVAAADDVGVTQVSLWLDGGLVASDDTAPFEFDLDTTMLTDGSHVLRAEAMDAAGNTGVSADVNIEVDNIDVQAPSVSVAAPASPASGVQTVVVTATDNVAVTEVQLFVDNALLATDTVTPYEFIWDTTAVGDGDHVLRAEAIDAAGNTGVSVDVTVEVDNIDEQAPSVSVAAPASPASGVQTVVVSATDNVAVTEVQLFVDDALLATDTVTPYEFIWDTTAVGDGNHVLRAEAMDAAGNTGVSADVSIEVDNIDEQAPSVSIAAPASPASGVRTVVVTATDNVAVTSVQLFVDDVLYETDAVAPYEFAWDTTAFSNGDHVLRAEATDAAGNTGVSGDATVTVDNTLPPDIEAPSVSVAAPGGPVSGVQTIVVTATDNVIVTEVRLFIDDAQFAIDATAPYEFEWDTTAVGNGDHVLHAEALDAAGNTGVSADVIVTVDNPDVEAPSVSVAAPASPASGMQTVVVTAADDVAVTSVQLFVDDVLYETDTVAPYEFDWNTSAFSDGDRVLRAEAMDAAGNTGVSANATVTVDNASPVVSITPPGGDVSGVASIGVDASDPAGVTAVRLFADGVLVAELLSAPFVFSWDVTALLDAQHVLSAEADDAAGNTGYADPIVALVANGTPQPTLPWVQDNVFDDRCISCHVDGGFGDLLWLDDGNSFAMLVNQFSTQVLTDPPLLVAPGDADNSYLIQKVEGTAAVGGQMPLFGAPLELEVIAAMRQWIDDDALESPADTIAPAVVLSLPAGLASGTITLSVTAVDNVAVDVVRFFVDGMEIGSDAVAPYEWNFDTTSVGDGNRIVTAEGEDAAGNIGPSAAQTLVVANN